MTVCQKRMIVLLSIVLVYGVSLRCMGVQHTICQKERPFSNLRLITADNECIQYTGRIDFSDPLRPRFWSPGVYVKVRYHGPFCEIVIHDECLWDKFRNYLEIVIDDTNHYRIQTTGRDNNIRVGESLPEGDHTLLICKDTEAGIGYLELLGFRCDTLLPLPEKPRRRIEFIGNSITCGSGIEADEIPCDSGMWYDQHNAYTSYGPLTARNLNAQWHLTSVSGIGLIHSCCNMTITMPMVFDKISPYLDSRDWDFSQYLPDLVTVCLGQNDGIQDSALFCDAYVRFIRIIRGVYPDADIICLTSPMAGTDLTFYLKKCLHAIVERVKDEGDLKVHMFSFSRSYNSGCGGHPGMEDHVLIARELTDFISILKGW